MKKEKQELVLRILNNGRYRVDTIRGVLQSFRVGKGEWVDCVANTLKSGYKQHIIFLGRYKKVRAVVYLHVLVYLSAYGLYEEGKVINHKDLDKGNCAAINLEAISNKENVDHSYANQKIDKEGKSVNCKIRFAEIEKIKALLLSNPKWSKARIARELGLNRIPATRVINKILNGEPL